MTETVWCITFNVCYLKKAIEFYEKALGLTKMYEHSGYSGFQCVAVEIGLIPKEKAEIGENAPTVKFIVDNINHFCEMPKSRGVDFEPPHDEHWGDRQASLKGPDGNLLGTVQIDWQKYLDAAAKGAKKQ